MVALACRALCVGPVAALFGFNLWGKEGDGEVFKLFVVGIGVADRFGTAPAAVPQNAGSTSLTRAALRYGSKPLQTQNQENDCVCNKQQAPSSQRLDFGQWRQR